MNLQRLIIALCIAGSFSGGYHFSRYLNRPVAVSVEAPAQNGVRTGESI